MADFIKALDAKDLPAGRSKCVELGGERIALFNVDGTVYAVQDTCTHAGGPLSEGDVDGTVVTCPWHGATFDLTTGQVTGPPARAAIQCHEVRVQGSEIQVSAP